MIPSPGRHGASWLRMEQTAGFASRLGWVLLAYDFIASIFVIGSFAFRDSIALPDLVEVAVCGAVMVPTVLCFYFGLKTRDEKQWALFGLVGVCSMLLAEVAWVLVSMGQSADRGGWVCPAVVLSPVILWSIVTLVSAAMAIGSYRRDATPREHGFAVVKPDDAISSPVPVDETNSKMTPQ